MEWLGERKHEVRVSGCWRRQPGLCAASDKEVDV
jgi:hypothetical protein